VWQSAKQCGFASSLQIYLVMRQIPISIVIYCDNQSCVKLSENPVFHDKSKHIEIKYHIRDMVQRKEVHIHYLSTHEQVADVFTKPLVGTKFKYFRERLGLVENAYLAETSSRSFSSGLSCNIYVRKPKCWVCPCNGCASDSGLNCDDVWSLALYSSGLS
jgi:hypothetical protein